MSIFSLESWQPCSGQQIFNMITRLIRCILRIPLQILCWDLTSSENQTRPSFLWWKRSPFAVSWVIIAIIALFLQMSSGLYNFGEGAWRGPFSKITEIELRSQIILEDDVRIWGDRKAQEGSYLVNTSFFWATHLKPFTFSGKYPSYLTDPAS